LERDLDIKEIKKKIEYYKEKEKELDKKQRLNKNGKSISEFAQLLQEYRGQKLNWMKLEKMVQSNNTDQWWIDLETAFLKEKEIFRENKIKLLEKINKILMSLKKKMGKNYKEFIKELYLNKLTDDTNTYTYTVKTIMKHLASGPISENAAKKSKKLNELKSRKNIYNRKTQMEIEIEMIKLKDVVEKFGKYEKLFIDRIKKIIDREDDDMMKQRLFQVVTINKINKNGKVVKKEVIEVKPTEFKNFISSTNQSSKYHKEIDKYKLILAELFEKDKSIRNRITKLKGMI